jgi:hypothetical protein
VTSVELMPDAGDAEDVEFVPEAWVLVTSVELMLDAGDAEDVEFVPEDDVVLVMLIDDAELKPPETLTGAEPDVELISLVFQVTCESVVSAITSARMDCCWSHQAGGPKSSPRTEIVTTPLLDVVADPLNEAEQAVTVEHESVIVDVDAVLAPEGVNTDNDVSQALAVRAEQELLEEE